jgi:phage protein D
MRPTFAITAAGNDITADVAARLVSMEIVDTVDESTDQLTIVFEDASGTLAAPASGAKIEVSLGYDGHNTRLGAFIIDEVTIEGPPDIITARGSSTPFVTDRKGGGTSEFQSRKSRSFEGKTIGDIVSTIAGECGLTPVVDKELEGVTIPHIDQVNESDANLLVRIARIYGGVLKPADGRLVLAGEGGGQTTSGKALELTLRPEDVSSYRVRYGGKVQGVTKVRARVHNYQTGDSEEVTADVEPA